MSIELTNSKKTDNYRRKPIAIAIYIAAALLTLAPILHITWVVTTTGADNLSNDYLQYVGLIDQILSGHYNWLNYIHDTFYRTHSVALPVLLHLADACFFHWNIYVELIAGIVLAIGRLFLIYSALSAPLKGWLKIILYPALAFLIFSNSQMSVFCYGDGALTIELSLFGFALGLWGLTRAKNPLAILTCLMAGGLIASFSWGNGLITWFVLLLGLFLQRCRSPKSYIAWFIGLSLSLIPYIQALILAPLMHSAPTKPGTTILSLLNWRFILNLIGWPFVNNIGFHAEGLPLAKTVGWIGLGLCAIGILLCVRISRVSNDAANDNDKQTGYPQNAKNVAALLLIAHGLLSIWQISVFRSLLAPWYTAVAMSFWIGLLGLAATLPSQLTGSMNKQSEPFGKFAKLWCVLVFAFITIAYICSNHSFEDKTDLFFSRSPASASALRHYRTAPTYCEPFVFQWGIGNPGLLSLLAEPLERHHLSVFAPHQIWALQGDYLFDTVKITHLSPTAPIIWTRSISTADHLPWSHYYHLNLFLPAPNTVSWTVSIPEDVREASFQSAAAVGQSDPKHFERGPISISITIDGQKIVRRSMYILHTNSQNNSWHEFKIPLTEFKGQTITISFNSRANSGQTPAAAVFRYPIIEIEGQPPEETISAPEIRPSNTDLSSALPQVTTQDFIFDLHNRLLWQFKNIDANESTFNVPLVLPVKPGITLSYRGDLSINLADFSHLAFSAGASPTISPRAVTLLLYLNKYAQPVLCQIPLLADGAIHTYSYDLKLLELAGQDKLTGISLSIVNPSKVSEKDTITLKDIRLIR